MLMQQITEEMKQAMKSGDKQKLAAIRMLRAAVKDAEIEVGHALTDDEVVTVVSKLIKQRRDAASQYAEAGRDDLRDKELAEVAVLEVYLPEQLSEEELAGLVAAAVAESGASSMRDMGNVMGVLRPKVQGRADMGQVSAMVKAALQG
jgi:hypothetical protein